MRGSSASDTHARRRRRKWRSALSSGRWRRRRRPTARLERQLAAESDELKAKVKEMKALRDSSATADDRLTRSQGELLKAQQDVTFYKNRIQQETKAEESKSREATALHKMNQQLTEQVAQLTAAADDRSREYSQMEEKVQELVRTRKERTELQAEVQRLTSQLQRLEASAASSHSSEAPRKRRREEEADEAKDDVSMPWRRTTTGRSTTDRSSPPRCASPPARAPSTLSGRPSLAPRRFSGGAAGGAEEALDPAKLTVQGLEELADRDRRGPAVHSAAQAVLARHQVYLHVPELNEHFPRTQAAGKGKKKK